MDAFCRYAKVLFKRFRNKVKCWFTIINSATSKPECVCK
ncbi:family 1 glycosylhydrolase [Clostridium uliginosum]